MSFRYPQPSNEIDFELFCKRLLNRNWKGGNFQRLGKRGERQFGIDLIDMSGKSPLRAVQCKHHESNKTIQFADIQVEVDEVLKYSVKIDEYLFLTSAKKTEDVQTKLLTLNKDHNAKGLFLIDLYTWQDIEELLDELGEDERDEVLRGDTGRKNSDIRRVVTEAVVDTYVSNDAIDRDLEITDDLSKNHDYKSSQVALNRIREAKWDKLTERQKYRWCVYLANTHIPLGNFSEAGRLLLEGYGYQPSDDRALINQALAYELLGNSDKAYALACDLRLKSPHSVPIHAICIRCSPKDLTFEEIEGKVDESVRHDVEIALALSNHALKIENLDLAEKYGKSATEVAPEIAQSWMALAQATHQRAMSAETSEKRSQFLTSAITFYSTAIEKAKPSNHDSLTAHLLLNRGIVYDLQGQGAKAERDYWDAAKLDPTNIEPVRRRALHLIETEKYDDAILLMQTVPSNKDSDRLIILLASALYERKAPGDLNSVIELCLRQSKSGSELKSDYLELAVRAYGKLNQHALIDQLLDSELVGQCSIAVKQILKALRLHLDGKDEEAREAGTQACNNTVGLAEADLRLLGRVLPKLGLDGEAIPILERVLRRGWFDAYTRLYLDCAKRTARHDLLLKVYAEQRDIGLRDKRMLYDELALLQAYDSTRGLEAVQLLLKEKPDDPDYLLWQSLYGLHLNRPELVCSDVHLLPKPETSDPSTVGRWVIGILVFSKQTEAALQFAYNLLRFHFDDVDAHNSYIKLFLDHFVREHNPRHLLDSPSKVKSGCAVGFSEKGEEPVQWVIIQDELPILPQRGERSESDLMVREMLGKNVGEQFVLARGSFQDRLGVVKDIKSKYTHVYQDCMHNLQLRFPEDGIVQLVRVGAPSEKPDDPIAYDFKPVLESLKDRRSHVEGILDLYSSQPVSIHLLTTAVGRDEFETLDHLLNSPDRQLRCCSGDYQERAKALDDLRASSEVVVDLTALYLLGFLDTIELLEKTQRKLIISESTLRTLQHIQSKSTQKTLPATIAINNVGNLSIEKAGSEQYAAYQAMLLDLLSFATKNCTIESCPELAAYDPEKREKLIELFGSHGTETLFLAKRENRILWTDDWVLGSFGIHEFIIRRAWTQVLILDAYEAGLIDLKKFNLASAKLLAHGYDFAWWNIEILKDAGETCSWNCDEYPLRSILEQFSSPRVNLEVRLQLACLSIRHVYSLKMSPVRKIAFVIRVCERLSNEGNEIWPVVQLKDLLMQLLGSKAGTQSALVQTIDIWLKTR
ncbi:MAG: hypothetical protein JNJ77_00865 [Planctomycetia bacterium]|nr:hypothetical protein [Planctomycetia bacterium]